MSRRRLREDELALWRQVAKTTSPLSRHLLRDPPVEPQKWTPNAKPPAEPASLSPFRVGAKAKAQPDRGFASMTDHMPTLPVRMDQKSYGKLKRGKLRPEARLDLHGLTVDRAHAALSGFVLRAYAQQKRLVLVITGKGQRRDEAGPIPVRQGVLRHNVPHWLGLPPLSDMVIQISPAHGRHGGGGAYYVYLRRPR